jgi:hypothetical protein
VRPLKLVLADLLRVHNKILLLPYVTLRQNRYGISVPVIEVALQGG